MLFPSSVPRPRGQASGLAVPNQSLLLQNDCSGRFGLAVAYLEPVCCLGLVDLFLVGCQEFCTDAEPSHSLCSPWSSVSESASSRLQSRARLSKLCLQAVGIGLNKIWGVLSSSLLAHPCWFFYSICSLSCHVFNNLHQFIQFLTRLSTSLFFRHFRLATSVLTRNVTKACFDIWRHYH